MQIEYNFFMNLLPPWTVHQEQFNTEA